MIFELLYFNMTNKKIRNKKKISLDKHKRPCYNLITNKIRRNKND